MTLEPGALAILVALIALGPWGIVLVAAIVRGYSLTIRLRRRARRLERDEPGDDTP